MTEKHSDTIVVALAQMAPVWLDRDATMKKILGYITDAADAGASLVAFGEGLLPGYPFWVDKTDGARFNSPVQKAIFAHYLDQAIQIESGHLDEICSLCGGKGIACYLGIIERPADRGGHSLYASMVYIDRCGDIQSVHRKLMPTYEERLVWSPGDGHGLRTHKLEAFTLGGLNCWENWMPLPRAALYGMGEDLHVAIWPGGVANTHDITTFIAKEARSYVLSVSGMARKSDIPDSVPHADRIRENCSDMMFNGGSCIAAPDGSFVVEPVADEEKLITATLDHRLVREERQNFDPVGHYSRPDVVRLKVNRKRQTTVRVKD